MADTHYIKPDSERFLRRAEAAEYLTTTYGIPVSKKTLAKWACVASDGPAFRKAGKFPVYPVSSLDEWAFGRLGPLVRSTAEADQARKDAES